MGLPRYAEDAERALRRRPRLQVNTQTFNLELQPGPLVPRDDGSGLPMALNRLAVWSRYGSMHVDVPDDLLVELVDVVTRYLELPAPPPPPVRVEVTVKERPRRPRRRRSDVEQLAAAAPVGALSAEEKEIRQRMIEGKL